MAHFTIILPGLESNTLFVAPLPLHSFNNNFVAVLFFFINNGNGNATTVLCNSYEYNRYLTHLKYIYVKWVMVNCKTKSSELHEESNGKV